MTTKRNTFGRLALLLAVVGALALAGCGGDDNGGLSATEQADLAEAKTAADAAKAAADKAAADLKAAEEKAAADLKAAADKAAADLKAAEEKAAADKADALTIDDVWEATFAPALKAEFEEMIGENPTINGIVAAILQLASDYGEMNPNTVAGLQAGLTGHFGGVVPTPATAWAYLQMLRENNGFLLASRQRALEVSPPADRAQATADEAKTTADEARTATTDDKKQYQGIIAGDSEGDRQTERDYTGDPETRFQWEVVFTPHLEAKFLTMIGSDPTIAEIRDVIRQIAMDYDEPHPYTRAGLESDMISYFGADPTAGDALAYFRQLRLGNRAVAREGATSAPYEFLAATRQRYEGAQPTMADTNGGDDGDMNGGDDDDKPMGLAAVLANPEADVDGATRADPMDFALPEGTKFTDEARGIESFSARVAPDYGGFGDDTFSTLGLWAEGVAAFTVLSGRPGGAVMAKPAIVGVPMDAPMGKQGTAYWTGKFTGAHLVDPGTAFDPATATTDNGQMVGRGDSVMGDVLLQITFDKNEDAKTLTATVDGFVPGESHKHMFNDVTIDTRGGFDDAMVLSAATGGTAADHAESMIDGQFYQSGQEGVAAGSLTLNNGFDKDMSHLTDPDDDTSAPLVGAKVDGTNAAFSHAVDQYYIKGVFVAPE